MTEELQALTEDLPAVAAPETVVLPDSAALRDGATPSDPLPPSDPASRIEELESKIQQLNAQLAERDDRLHAIQEIGIALSSIEVQEKLLALIVEKTTYLMRAERSTVYLLEPNGELSSKIAQGSRVAEIRLKVGEGIAGWVVKKGKSLNIKDAYRDPRFNQSVDERTGFRTHSCLCQPIRNQRREIIGALQVLNKRDGYFSVEDENLLSMIASQAGVAIESMQLYLRVVAKNLELEEYRGRLEHKIREIDLLYELEHEAAKAPSLDALAYSIGQRCIDALEAEFATLVLRGERVPTLYLVRRLSGGRAYDMRTLALAQEGGIHAEVLAHGEPILRTASDAEPIVDPPIEGLGLPLRSVLAVPLFANEQAIGVLKLGNKTGYNEQHRQRPFDHGDLKLLTVIASQVSSAVIEQLYRERREKAQRLSSIGQLVSSLLHDLKTPISVISGYVQLMVRQEKIAKREEYAEAILRQFETLNSMTKEILAFVRGDSTVLIRKVYLSRFMEEARQMLQNELLGHNVELALDIRYRGTARFDEVKLKRVFANLARNAAEAMPEGGRLRVVIEKQDDKLIISFADTGRGIPREIQPRLFESFVTKGKKNGTGLGLAIVKKIVDEHHGSISYQSTENVGTEFRLALPLEPTL